MASSVELRLIAVIGLVQFAASVWKPTLVGIKIYWKYVWFFATKIHSILSQNF